MGFGGALSYSGLDGVIAAGIASLGMPPILSTALSLSASSCEDDLPEPTVTFGYALPPVDVSLNVLVNGYSMTVEADIFGELDIIGDLGLTLESCNPIGDFEVPTIASVTNVLVNGIRAAIPDIPYEVSPIIDAALMAMQTQQVNVIIYY